MNAPIIEDATELVASILAETVPSVNVRHVPAGIVPPVETVPTVQVQAMLSPRPRYDRRAGVHIVTCRLVGINPTGWDSPLASIPDPVNRGTPLVGESGSILRLERGPRSRRIAPGGVHHGERVRVTVAERRPALAGVPYAYRFESESRRFQNLVGASAVSDVLHGVEENGDGAIISTLTFKLPAVKGLTRTLRRQQGWHVDGIGTIAGVEVGAPEPGGLVPVSVTYEARV